MSRSNKPPELLLNLYAIEWRDRANPKLANVLLATGSNAKRGDDTVTLYVSRKAALEVCEGDLSHHHEMRLLRWTLQDDIETREFRYTDSSRGVVHGHYASLQFCPEPSRDERFNIGFAVLFAETKRPDMIVEYNYETLTSLCAAVKSPIAVSESDLNVAISELITRFKADVCTEASFRTFYTRQYGNLLLSPIKKIGGSGDEESFTRSLKRTLL